MKGYSPTFNVEHKSEMASKENSTFIELGTKTIKHVESCKCIDCIRKNT